MNTYLAQFQNNNSFPVTPAMLFRSFQFVPNVFDYSVIKPLWQPKVNIPLASNTYYVFPSSKNLDKEPEYVKIKSEEISVPYEKTTATTNSQVSKVNTANFFSNIPTASESYIRQELNQMITFLLLKMGNQSQTEIETFRNKYRDHPYLAQIYDKLVMKYFSAKKTKEDILRYILRRAFKSIKTTIMHQEKVSSKKATAILCKKYFQKSLEQMKGKVENDDELLELFMPYNKKSQNKTMNSNFVAEIFSSDEFCQEYRNFLRTFSDVIMADNKRKKEKLIKYIMECIKTKSVSKIMSFNRFPWLDLWVKDTIQTALDLPENGNIYNSSKRTKIFG